MKQLLGMLLAVVFISGLIHPVSAAADKEDVKDEIMYDIVVDRFNNGDSSLKGQAELSDPYTYHGGDLQGIIAKLDQLKKYGYTTLVLSPVMANAPKGYHGYWIEDFYKVDEQFGTMADLQELVKEAHDRDMKIVLEFVTNYAADTHPMTDDPAKHDWYSESQGDTSFQWQDHTVTLDQTNSHVRQFLTDVADYWMDETDIDGYQFHAADKANQNFLGDLTAHLQENYPNIYLLGDRLDKTSGDGELTKNTAIQMTDNPALMPVMSDVFAAAGKPVTSIYETWQNNGRQKGLNYLDTPSSERFSEKVVNSKRNVLTAWKLALTYLYTLPGTPMVYQGSEIPMLGEGFPENQNLVEWNSADEDLEKFNNRIASLRSEFPALRHGDYEMVDSNGAMSLFKRSFEGESLYIAINNDKESQMIPVSSINQGKQLNGLLGDNLVRANDDGDFEIVLPRETAEIYSVETNTGLNWWFIAPIVGILFIFIAGLIYLKRKEKKREAAD
ncbi:hypothetical protein GCM10028778_14400 [Barrientosiimonas marina]|uniref:Alpha-amylase family glycosyl hydrolase n=1 Tax=Lentibacillus kimchii TaxID=1542911 RepID=A0ABW2UT22_9BACI